MKKYEPQPVPKCTTCGKSNKDCCCKKPEKSILPPLSANRSAEETAQWVIDNRYPKGENEKVSDFEVYQYLIKAMQEFASSVGREEYQKFNLNEDIFVEINPKGWEYLKSTVGDEYVESCIMNRKTIIDDKEYYRLQAHSVIDLFGGCIHDSINVPINPNILIKNGNPQKAIG